MVSCVYIHTLGVLISDFQHYTIELQCESVRFGDHWAGITFYNTTTTSTISHLNVEYGGVKLMGNRTYISHGILSKAVPLDIR